jgi:hypothetical protein
MLYDLSEKPMTGIPHRDEYDMWMRNLSPVDHAAVVAAVNAHIDPLDWFVSSFVPGKDWTNTVYEPLYHACHQNMVYAGLFFGLIVWQAVIGRDDEWFFKPAERDFEDILGTTYFRKR